MRKKFAPTDVPKSLLAAALFALLPLLGSASEITFISLGTTDRANNPGGSPNWRYRLGTSEASTPVAAWRTNNFVEDGTWSTGALPLGYATAANDPNGYEAALVTTVPAATTCVYLRKTFVITNRLSYSAVTVNGFADDGVVVWINGREASSRFQCCTAGGDPNIPTFDALATTALESLPFSFSFANDATGPLVEGTNVVCIQLLNANNTSSDLVLDASVSATVDDVSPVVSGQAPQAGSTVVSLTAIQVNFSEAVAGVDASDLLINGVAATNLINISPSIYTFEFTQPGTGVVSVTFASPHGIADNVGNPLTTNAWSYVLSPNAVVASVYISEFLASNNGNGTNALRDEDGDASDWIELRNPAAAPANIGGWFLTDATNTLANPNNLTKWRIPNGTTVPGNGYLVIFASGKNRTNNLARLHSNFQLAASGEYLALLDANTNIVSQFYPAYPANQIQNVSYGRDQADPNILGFFAVPTPGAANNTGSNPALDVQFSRTGGTFAGTFQLSLTSAVPNAIIRYTIISAAQDVNNATNIPTTSSTLYNGPITLNNSVQVRARAFPASPGSFPGAPRTECYIQIVPGITNFVSSLPIVIIHTIAPTSLSGGFPALDNAIMIACMDNDTPSGLASIMDPPQMVKRAGLNLRGSSTQGFPKSSFAIEFWDEFNSDEEASFAGLPKESDWVLYAPNQFDLSLMHNPIMHQLGRDFGYYSSRTRFVEVFVRNNSGAITGTTNSTSAGMGDYNGVYVLEEKVKRDGNRVDIDILQPEHTSAPEITGGYLLKVDRTDGNERTFVGGGMTINYVEPDGLEMVTPARAAQAAYIKSYLDNMNNGLQGANLINVNSTNHYSNYIDVDATIDLHIGNVMVMNADGYRLSGYMYKPRGGKLIAGPLWDTDRGLGTLRGDQRTYNPRSWQSYDASGCGGTDYGTDFFGGSGVNTWSWLTRWFSDVDFWQRWVDRYQEKRTSSLDTNRLVAIVDKFANEVREAQVREVKRWGGNGASDTSPRSGLQVSCNSVYTHMFPTPGTYQGEVDFQKRWLIDHVNFMDTNLLNRPSHNLSEGQVPLGTVLVLTDTSGKPGTQIYYTLDGSDPRGLQGVINPAALLYTSPITITSNVRVRARARNLAHSNMTGTTASGARNPILSTPWSGDTAATYFISPPPLVISELMFHPAPSASLSDTNDPDNFEYVELKNIGTNSLNLAGFQFTNGITFTFSATNGVTSVAPGGYVLIVKNLASFTARYGAKTNIAGVYQGNLDNSGERITFVGPRLEPILDFTYSDDWYPLADGLGFSLVILDPTAPLNTWDERQSWRISAGENGSPGVVDPTPPPIPVIFVNEALTHTDLPSVDTIELYNPGASPANVGGWYLTDDPGEPKKYQIPNGTIIPAGGFLLVDETQFNAGVNAFALGSSGDDVYVFSATNGLLTGWAHGFEFGAAQNGVTFGRYVTSQNRDHFVAQATNTLGALNSLPRIGPIVISEIMYHPVDLLSGTNLVDNSIDEFVELYNITTNAVPLYHPTNLISTWHLRGGADFDFPSNTSIAPTSFVFVVNFNPQTNLTQLATFRAKYGVAASIPIYGPYKGKLDNSSESVRINRPDNPNIDGSVPYILIDQVDYEDSGAWSSTADGIGASLQRLVLTDYGNDPTNWVAAAPSAAARFKGGTPPSITQQPANASQFLGSATNFVASVSGTGVSIQWRFNNTPIPGATNAVLTLPNIQYAQGGSYNFVAFNSAGSAFSSNATLTVITPVFFTVQPLSQNVQPGTNVTISAQAVGNGPVRYQWYFQGGIIPGATNSSHSFTGANLNDHHGFFSVVATDDLGSTTSSNAEIYVMVRVGIVTQIQPMTVLQGGTVTFSVTATGAPTLWYRWIRGGAAFLTNTLNTLTLTNVQVGGTYRVGITNRATPAGIFSLPSGSVTLTVLADADRDGIADAWETNYFGSVNTTNNASNALEDPDGDGMINRDEYVAGTDPTDPLSVLKIILSGTNSTNLRFVAQTNISYSVQARTNLTSGIWSSVTNIAAQSGMRTIEVNNAFGPPVPQRYFRVITPQTP